MAKITRFNGNLEPFGADAVGTERTVFGDTTQSNDLTDNINAGFRRGWGVLSAGAKPPKQWFNGAMFTVIQVLAYLHQMGIAEWNGEQEYQEGSAAIDNGSVYICKTADHTSATSPENDTTNWSRLLKLADSSSDATADKLALRDENGTFKVGEATDPAHPALSGSARNTVTVTGDHTVAAPTAYGQQTVNVDAATATITLPDGVPEGGRILVRKINSTQGTVSIASSGSDTITRAGLTSVSLNADGDNWLLEKVSATRWELVDGVESGENSDGTFYRYHDGNQSCFIILTFTTDINVPQGELFRSDDEIIWEFPREFVGDIRDVYVPIPQVAVNGGVNVFVTRGRDTTTDTSRASYALLRPTFTNQVLDRELSCSAFGRWYE